jgi:hypothetical protein
MVGLSPPIVTGAIFYPPEMVDKAHKNIDRQTAGAWGISGPNITKKIHL